MSAPVIFRIFKNNQLVSVKQFTQDQVVIGHDAEVNLDLDSEEVSPIHCLIERRENGFYVCDLGSKSGTFKNGQPILDESISSGDELIIGPFKIIFFVGVPKPQVSPLSGEKPEVKKSADKIPDAPAQKTKKMDASSMPPVAFVKKEEVNFIPTIPKSAPSISDERPVIVNKVQRIGLNANENQSLKGKKTFAPESEIRDLKSYLQPTKGSNIEVLVAWKERILTTYHFEGKKPIRVNSNIERQISLPNGLVPKNFLLIDPSVGLRINLTNEMNAEVISRQGSESIDELIRTNRAQKNNYGHSLKLEQNEMLALTLPGNNLVLYIRNVPRTPVVPLFPLLALSGTEVSTLIMSVILVGLLALYVSATTPKDWQENNQEEVQRMAQVIFNKPIHPVMPKVEAPQPEVKKTEPIPVAPPEKKVVVDEKKREIQKKGSTGGVSSKQQVAARASEVGPKPLSKNNIKKFTATRQGGAMKLGTTSGSNAQSSNRDLSKMGLYSSFGGGGIRAQVEKAYSGSGGVLGINDKATGASGFNEERSGEDLGSKFKDVGAGGKGTSSEGIANIVTKGRGSGQSAYGIESGTAIKTSVAIAGGGFDESFDATIDKDSIRRVIKSKLNELRGCYERALNTLEKGKRLEGKVVFGWEIVEKGQARNVKVVSSTLGNAQVENCIRTRLASWIFPEPPPDVTAVVKAYPFVLNQQN